MNLTAPKAPVRSKEHTRQLLISAAIDVFVTKGVQGAAIDDLTRAAGFTRGAFYSNFESKQEVFWAAFAEVTSQAITSVKDASDGTKDYSDAPALLHTLDSLQDLMLQWYVLHTEAVSAALHDQQARELLGQQRARLAGAIAQVFDALAESAQVSLLMPSALIAETLLGAYLNRMVTNLVEGASGLEETTRIMQGILDTFVQRG